MNFESIDQIFSINDAIHADFAELIGQISREDAGEPIEGEKWSIAEIVEHLAMSEQGMSRICAILIKKAEANGDASDGRIDITNTFEDRGVAVVKTKMEAPDIVQPTGMQPVDESLAAIDGLHARLSEIKHLFNDFDGNKYKFPHPFFGDLSAIEWLVLIGQHKIRHTAQIRRIVAGPA